MAETTQVFQCGSLGRLVDIRDHLSDTNSRVDMMAIVKDDKSIADLVQDINAKGQHYLTSLTFDANLMESYKLLTSNEKDKNEYFYLLKFNVSNRKEDPKRRILIIDVNRNMSFVDCIPLSNGKQG